MIGTAGTASRLAATARESLDREIDVIARALGQHGSHGATASRERAGHVFLFFSNNLGCLGSLIVSVVATLILLALLRVLRAELWRLPGAGGEGARISNVGVLVSPLGTSSPKFLPAQGSSTILPWLWRSASSR